MSIKKKCLAIALSLPIMLGISNTSFADSAIQIKKDKEANVVEVREKPNRSSDVLGVVNENTIYNVLETKKGWYKIKWEDKEGYVASNFFNFYEEMTLKDDTEIYGKKDSNDAVDKLKKGEKVLLLDPEIREKTYIRYKDKLGFVNPENLSKSEDFSDKSFKRKEDKEELREDEVKLIEEIFDINNENNDILVQETDNNNQVVNVPTNSSNRNTDTPTTNTQDNIAYVEYNIEPKQKQVQQNRQIVETTPAQINTQNTSAGQAIVNEARRYIGYPYVWGGSSLTGGIDCSGFSMVLYRNLYGINMPHLASSQATYGKTIPFGQQRAGDLVFFGNSWGNIWHVAIATDNGTIVHASNPRDGIKEGPIYQTPFVIKRIVE